MADFGRFGLWSPAAQMAGTPRGAGISGKKKGPETIRTLQFGGVGSPEKCPETSKLRKLWRMAVWGYRQNYRQACRARVSSAETVARRLEIQLGEWRVRW